MGSPSTPTTTGTWISLEWLSQQDPIAWVNADIWESCMRPDLEQQWSPERLLRCKTGERLDKIMPILRSWWQNCQTLPPDNILANFQIVWVNTFLWTTLMARNTPIFWEVYPVLHLGASVYARINNDCHLELRSEPREVRLDAWEKEGDICRATFMTNIHPQPLAFEFTWEEASLVMAFRHRTAQDHILKVLARSEPSGTPPNVHVAGSDNSSPIMTR